MATEREHMQKAPRTVEPPVGASDPPPRPPSFVSCGECGVFIDSLPTHREWHVKVREAMDRAMYHLPGRSAPFRPTGSDERTQR